MDKKEIVKNLRAMRKSFCPILTVEMPMCGAMLVEEAADLIESQAKVIDELREKIDIQAK